MSDISPGPTSRSDPRVLKATVVVAVACARGFALLEELGHQAAVEFDRQLADIGGLRTPAGQQRAASLLADADTVIRLTEEGVLAEAERTFTAQVRDALRELEADPAAGPMRELLGGITPEQVATAAGVVARLTRLDIALVGPDHAAAVARRSAELASSPDAPPRFAALLRESAEQARTAAVARRAMPIFAELRSRERTRESRIRHATRLVELASRDLVFDSDVFFSPPPGPEPEILAWLRESLDPRLYEPEFERKLALSLGADLFALRKLPPPPDFLTDVDIPGLRPEHIAPFLRRISLTRPRPKPADLRTEALDTERGTVSTARRSPEQRRWLRSDGSPPPLLPERTAIPRVVHGIWIGGPMPSYSAFRDHYAKAATRYAGEVDIVLWTDIPRATAEAALSTAPPADGDDPLAAARSLLTWARNSGVHVINIHEVFHADHPMHLHAQYVLESAKQLPRGYASASDHLRVDLIHTFGGLYTDGDIRFDIGQPGGQIAGTVPELLDAVAASTLGFTLNCLDDPQIGNDLFAGPAWHPALRLWIEDARLHYCKTQREIIGPEMTGRYVGTWYHVGRHIAPYRSGRVHHVVLAQLGIKHGDLTPTRGMLEYRSEVTWAKPPIREFGSRQDEDQVLLAVKRLVVFLIWQLVTREGNLYLAAAAPVVRQMPDPDAVWIAILHLLASIDEVRGLVTSVTDFRIGDDGSDERIELPPEAEALLDRRATPPRWMGSDLADSNGRVWLLDEAITPVALLPTLIARASGR